MPWRPSTEDSRRSKINALVPTDSPPLPVVVCPSDALPLVGVVPVGTVSVPGAVVLAVPVALTELSPPFWPPSPGGWRGR